jgi:hypothetical protein
LEKYQVILYDEKLLSINSLDKILDWVFLEKKIKSSAINFQLPELVEFDHFLITVLAIENNLSWFCCSFEEYKKIQRFSGSVFCKKSGKSGKGF